MEGVRQDHCHIYEEIEHIYEAVDDLNVSSKSPLPPRHLTRSRSSLKKTTSNKESPDSKVGVTRSALSPRHLIRATKQSAKTHSKATTAQAINNDLKESPMFSTMALQNSDLQSSPFKVKTGSSDPSRRKETALDYEIITSIGCSEGREHSAGRERQVSSTANSPDRSSEHMTDSEDSSGDEECPVIPPRLYLLDQDFARSIDNLDCSAIATEKKLIHHQENSSSARNLHQVQDDSKVMPHCSIRYTRSSHSIPSQLNDTSNRPNPPNTPKPPLKRTDHSPHYQNVSIRRKKHPFPSDPSSDGDGGSESKTLPRARRRINAQIHHKDQPPSSPLYANISSSSETDLYQPLVPVHHAPQDTTKLIYTQAKHVARKQTVTSDVRTRKPIPRASRKLKRSQSRDSIEH